MVFDWTISLGNILTVVGFASSGVIFVMMMRSDIMILSHRVEAVENALKDLAQASFAIARQGARLEALDDRMNMISRRLDEFILKTK